MKLKNIEADHEEIEDVLISLYIKQGMPSFEAFKDYINEIFPDINEQLIKQITDSWIKAKKHIEKINDFVHEIRSFPSRKDIAEAINRNRKQDSALAFCLLDEKIITNKQYFSLIKQNI